MPTYTIHVDRWHPAKLNQLIGGHWAKAARLKGADRDIVALAARQAGTPKATGRRRVSFTITLGPRRRAGDSDSYFKSLLDSLVSCGMLVDDNRQNCELMMPTFVRGQRDATTIILEDVG